MLLTRSSRIATLIVAVVLFAMLSCLASDCQAQRRRFVPGQELGRFLGMGHGAGFHCADAGQNTDYYNPYSAHNSMLTAGYGSYDGHSQVYSDFDSNSVPHSSYTGRDAGQHSVFESLPGQTVQPKFEPAVDRTRRAKDGAAFEPNSDFDTSSNSDFDSPSQVDDIDSFSPENLATEDEGGFDSLKSNYDDVQSSDAQLPKTRSFGEDEASFLD